MLISTPQPNNNPPSHNAEVGNCKRPLVLAGRNTDGTSIRKMCTFTKEGRRKLERQLDQSGYEEPLLEREELYYLEEGEDQGHSRREYNTNNASNDSAGRHLLIKLKLSSFIPEILNHFCGSR